MQLNMYNWSLIEISKKSTLRQGVISAKTEKEAKDYLVASMNQDEFDFYSNKNNTLSFVKIGKQKE